MTVTTVNFDPDKKRIEDIFEGSQQLVIPRYQRTYSWPKDKAEEFYNDFIEESAILRLCCEARPGRHKVSLSLLWKIVYASSTLFSAEFRGLTSRMSGQTS